MKKTAMLIISFVFMATLSCAETGDTPSANRSDAKPALKDSTAGMKLERGFKNVLFGWTDIPRSVIQVTCDSKNPFWGLTAGTLKGVGKAFPRTASGLSDVVSFPIADYNKSPIKPDEWKTQIK